MSAYGDTPRMVRVWTPGSDHSSDLAEVNATWAGLTDQLGTPVLPRGTPQRARLGTRIGVLTTRQAELSSMPTQPAGWTYEPTDDLVKGWWTSAILEERHVWPRSLRIRVVWRSQSEAPDPSSMTSRCQAASGRLTSKVAPLVGVRFAPDVSDVAVARQRTPTKGPSA
jgi:site-specific DNA recombinase